VQIFKVLSLGNVQISYDTSGGEVDGRPAFDSLAESNQRLKKLVFTASLLDFQHLKGLVWR